MDSSTHITARLSDFRAVIKARLLLLSVVSTLIFLVGIGYLLVTPGKYEASVVVTPNTNRLDQQGGLLGRLGGGSASASAAATLLGGNSWPPDYANFLQVITSYAVAKRIILKHPEYLRVLFSKEWDNESHSWHQKGLTAHLKGLVNSALGRPMYTPPDAYRLSRYLSDNVTVDQIGQNAIHQITYRNPDPTFAKNFVVATLFSADDIIKDKSRAVFLEQENDLAKDVQDTTIADYRDSLITYLSQVQSELSAVTKNAPYAVVVLDEPWVTPTPISPDPILTLAATFALIIMVDGAIVFYYIVRGISPRNAATSKMLSVSGRAGA